MRKAIRSALLLLSIVLSSLLLKMLKYPNEHNSLPSPPATCMYSMHGKEPE